MIVTAASPFVMLHVAWTEKKLTHLNFGEEPHGSPKKTGFNITRILGI